LCMSVLTYKGPARAANILPVKVIHTTGCLKEVKNVPTCTRAEVCFIDGNEAYPLHALGNEVVTFQRCT
jgi:hypothetical protein